jgi:hypothetical protein
VILGITTVIFALMAFAPGASPVKTPAINRANQSGTEDQIKEVATRFTENLITFNYEEIDEFSERALRDATQQFATQEQLAIPGGSFEEFKDQIERNQSQSTGEVLAPAVTAQSGDTATAVVVTRQTSGNREREERTRTQVLQLALLKVSGSWKVDKVGFPTSE